MILQICVRDSSAGTYFFNDKTDFKNTLSFSSDLVVGQTFKNIAANFGF